MPLKSETEIYRDVWMFGGVQIKLIGYAVQELVIYLLSVSVCIVCSICITVTKMVRPKIWTSVHQIRIKPLLVL